LGAIVMDGPAELVSGVALNLVVLRSANLRLAAAFYAALGLTIGWERHGAGPEHMTAQAGGVLLEIYPLGERASTAGVRLGFVVPNLALAVAAVRVVGGAVVSLPQPGPWGLRAVVEDADGHRIELLQGA